MINGNREMVDERLFVQVNNTQPDRSGSASISNGRPKMTSPPRDPRGNEKKFWAFRGADDVDRPKIRIPA